MRIKAIIVVYAFSVQYFENATIVAYVGVRVKARLIYTQRLKYMLDSAAV